MIYIILILALVFRTISINQSLWLDEATTALVSKLSITEIFNNFLPGDFHPPLYYLVIKFWTGLFGYSEISLRTPSIIVGLLTIFIVYKIGEVAFSKKTGLIASALLATSGLHIYYSQEARMYSMTALFVSLAFFSFVKILKVDRVGYWVLFSVSLALVALTDYLAIFVIPVFWVYSIIAKKSISWWKKYFMSHIILIILAALWTPLFIMQLKVGLGVSDFAPVWWEIIGQTSIKNIALIPIKFILGRISFENDMVYSLISLVVCAIYGSLLLVQIKSKVGFVKLIQIWLVFPLAIATFLGFKVPVLQYFRFIFLLPAFYLLVTIGYTSFKKPMKNILLVAIFTINLASSGYYLFNSNFHREDWRALVGFIESQKTDSSTTVFVSGSNTEAYRYYAHNAKITPPLVLTSGFEQIWHVRYAHEIFDHKNLVVNKIESLDYVKTGEFGFRGITVWRYEK